ncbi:RnfABCDGE type electron transport complex subunit D [Halothece sp. PCC 7418]|uniref:RnfABCDGE type electron transport complex subunit D n=1 Tax=Halothece sp. (strain PCC 7418) TaxID=65093 RepID=UPI0005A27ED8|nr:RnfABCDGE type electron transport complex subunit D [Halothece sp. PCC 7418]
MIKQIPELTIDLRDVQVFALSWFLGLGVMSHRFETLNAETMVVAIIGALSLQYLAFFFLKKKETVELISRSALITGLGLCLLLRTHSLAIMGLAVGCAILSKFLIKYRGKHLFNPANFGIIAVLCLTDQAWISPGQWGESFSLALLFVGMGGLILSWLGRWETTAVFLLVYSVGILARNTFLGLETDIFWHELNSGSLLLFAFFMLSDPRSIPDAKWGRMIWASAIALLTLFLKYQLFLATAPFFALFICSFLTPVFDYFWQGKRFHWNGKSYQLGGNENETVQI